MNLLVERAASTGLEWLLRVSRARIGISLVYHAVGEPSGDSQQQLVPPMAPDDFRAHVRHVTRHYRTVRATDLLDAVSTRRRGERIPVAITFDDDLRSHAETAAPVLRGNGATATFFLCGASLDGPHEFWWETLQRVADRHGLEPLGLTGLWQPGDGIREVAARIEAMPPGEQHDAADRLAAIAGPPPASSGLRAEAVHDLASAGFEIGFHTLGHHRLPGLDAGAVAGALNNGRDRLEELSDRPVTAIAYPHGRPVTVAKEAGFTAGFTTEPGVVTAASDPLTLPRIDPAGIPVRTFGLALAKLLMASTPRGGRARRWLRRARVKPAIGAVRFGDLRRLEPISRTFGFDRGLPVDRYYIERFLARGRITGRVLEIGDDTYARKFGRGVEAVDVLDIEASNPRATIVADLASGEGLPETAFDSIICTQTLLLVYDVSAAVRNLARMLKPGGVLLATVPGISPVCRAEMEQHGDYWRFTSLAVRRLFEEVFPPENVHVETFGNVLASVAFLHGLCTDDVGERRLERRDPDYELIIGVRALKPEASPR